MALTPESVADHISAILPDLDKGNFEDVAAELQDYPIMRVWLKRMHIELGSGLTITKNLMQRTGDAARFTAPDHTDKVDIPNLHSKITVPWRHAQTSWGYNYDSDILMNRGASQIVDLVKMRRQGAMIDMAAVLENKGWSLCASDNDVDPYGIPNWVVYPHSGDTGYTAATAPGAFVGGPPTGWTTVAGLTDLTNYRNYASPYVTVSKEDLLPSMRQGHELTMWMSPLTSADASNQTYENRRYYTNSYVNRRLESLGEGQNENLGRDLASMTSGTSDIRKTGEGYLTIFRHPICFVPQLNDATVFPSTVAVNPIYQIDHNAFKTYCLKGGYMREYGPTRVPDMHNYYRTITDLVIAHVCFNRRKQAIYSQ